jgi:uncharacterized protein YfiM (DUF2279 family)
MSLSGPAIADRNTLLHLGGSAVGAGMLSMACYGFTFRQHRTGCAVFGFATMNGVGLIMEIMDAKERDLGLDTGDVTANAAGAAFGTALYLIATHYYDITNPPRVSPLGPNGSAGVTLRLEY